VWKILRSTTPLNEQDLNNLAGEGWELKMCVRHEGAFYWYLFKGN
jgi:hypothetical protein